MKGLRGSRGFRIQGLGGLEFRGHSLVGKETREWIPKVAQSSWIPKIVLIVVILKPVATKLKNANHPNPFPHSLLAASQNIRGRKKNDICWGKSGSVFLVLLGF